MVQGGTVIGEQSAEADTALVIPERFPSCQGGVRGGLYRGSSDVREKKTD